MKNTLAFTLLISFIIYMASCNKPADTSEYIQPYMHVKISDTTFSAGALSASESNQVLQIQGWKHSRQIFFVDIPKSSPTGTFAVSDSGDYKIKVVRHNYGSGYATSGSITIETYDTETITGTFNGTGIFVSLSTDTSTMDIKEAEFLFNFL